MRSVLKLLSCVLAVGPLAVQARVTMPEVGPEQYHAIPQRNAFALRPPAAPAAQTNPPAPLPKITLTGITTILGNKRALMKVAPAGAKVAEAGKEQSLILTEGQRQGEVEVLQIDEHAESVKVNNSGTVMTLTLEKDGAKLPATRLPAAVPVAPPPLPGAVLPSPYLPDGSRTRNPRSRGLGALTPALPGSPSAPVGGVPTPTGMSSGTVQNSILADQQLTAEEQAIVNAFQRQENAENANNSGSLPLPTAPAPANGVQQPGVPVIPVGGNSQSTRVLIPQ